MSEPSVIDASQVRIANEPRRIPIPSDAAKGESSVELLRQANEVVGAEVTCTCGNCIRLRFDYET